MAEGEYETGKEPLKYIFVILVITVFTFSYAYSISRYQDVNIETGSLNADLIMRRIFYSSECFAYDENGRVYSGELDFEKISSERLKECIPERYLVEVISESSNETFYNNKAEFENNKGFCKFKEKYSCHNNKDYFKIRNEDKEIFDVFYVRVIQNL